MARSLEKIRMLESLTKQSGDHLRCSEQRKPKLAERKYRLELALASYDPLPEYDGICDIVTDGLGDEFPNCTIAYNVKFSDEEDPRQGENVSHMFRVGDVIAYRTLEDNRPEWVAWEVGAIDDRKLTMRKPNVFRLGIARVSLIDWHCIGR